MAAKPEPRKPIIRSPYARPTSKRFVQALWALKGVALLLGVAGTGLSLMAAVGALSSSLTVRLAGAAVVSLVGPAVLWVLLRSRTDSSARAGLLTDVFAVCWLGFTFLFAFAANAVTGPVFAGEALRLADDGVKPGAQVGAFLAGPAAMASAVAAAKPKSGADAGAPAADTMGFAGEAAATIPVFGAPDARGSERPLGAVFQDVSASVVTLLVRGKHGDSGGSGVLVDAAGTILTAHSVIADAGAVLVRLRDGRYLRSVDLLADDPTHNLALLRADLSTAKGSQPGDAALPKAPPFVDDASVGVGERLFVVGNPLGLDPTLTVSTLAGRRAQDGRNVLELSASTSVENAGAPIASTRGDVVALSLGGRLAVPVIAAKALFAPSYPGRRHLVDLPGSMPPSVPNQASAAASASASASAPR